MQLNLDYFYGGEAEQFSFYRIPKVLFTDYHYKLVSVEAKTLYGLLLDRMGLSLRNGWFDEEQRVYIFYTLDDAIDMMNLGHNKAVKLFKELEDVGLIERRKQGQGHPARIYVKNFIVRENRIDKTAPGPLTPNQDTAEYSDDDADNYSSKRAQTFQNRKSRLPKNGSQDFPKSEVQTSQNRKLIILIIMIKRLSILIYQSIPPPPCLQPLPLTGVRVDSIRWIDTENKSKKT